MNTSQKITELSSKWYQYVSLDHHKDQDCHWNINVTYSYGQPPIYQAAHYGYITVGEGEVRDNLSEAENDLLGLLGKAVEDERENHQHLIDNPVDDEVAMEVARKFFEIFVDSP